MIKNTHTHQINKCAEVRLRWYISNLLNLLNYVYDKSFHHYLTEYSLCTDFSFKCNKYDLKNPGHTVPQKLIHNRQKVVTKQISTVING